MKGNLADLCKCGSSSPEYKDLKLLSLFGHSGGTVGRFIKLKSLFVVIDDLYNHYFDWIEWDRDFFGRYSEELSNDICDFQRHMYMGLYLEPKKLIFNYKLSGFGNHVFEMEVNLIEKILEHHSVEPKEFAITCLAYNSLPANYVFNEAFNKEIKFLRRDLEDEPTRQSWWCSYPQFFEEGLDTLVELYNKRNILLIKRDPFINEEDVMRTKSCCFKYTPTGDDEVYYNINRYYNVKIDPELPVKMYGHLEPSFESSIIDLSNINSEFSMKRYRISKEELNQKIEQITTALKNNKEVYLDKFNSYIDKLQKFCENANSCSEGIIISIDKYNYFSIIVTPELKQKTPDWNFGYINHIFHILRPHEMYDLYKK